MKIGILTHNVLKYNRVDLLLKTIKNSQSVFGEKVIVFDNNSNDGTPKILIKASHNVVYYISTDGNHSPGRGYNYLFDYLVSMADSPEDIIVSSDDDILWNPDAPNILTKFWSMAPDNIVLVSGLLEPEWHWNIPRSVIEAGGVKALVRDSASGCAWSFPAKNWSRIGPLIDDFGQDYEACIRIRKRGGLVAEIDLCEHIGWGKSTHKNDAIEFARPLDRKRWGI